jgi:subtilase family serine protease
VQGELALSRFFKGLSLEKHFLTSWVPCFMQALIISHRDNILPNSLRIRATCAVFLVFLVIGTVFLGFSVRPAFSQSSVVLSGNVLPFLRQAQTLASPNTQVESQTRLTLAIGLAMRNRAGLDAYIAELHDASSSNYHKWLTPVEIANEFGPSQGDYDAVVAWLQGQGIKVTQTFNHRLVIMASTTADQASRVFGVSFGAYHYNHQTFVAAANEPSVPAQLSEIVSSITGLDTYYGLVSHLAQRVTVGQAGPNSLSLPYTPANIRTAYNLPVLSAGVKMGVLSACEASTTDLNGFASTYGLPSYNTNYFRVAVNSKGDGSDPPTDQEPTLDVEWSHALAPGANLYFYFDNDASFCGAGALWSFSGMTAAAAKALADNLVQTWSTSWGCSENNCYNSGTRGAQDAEYVSMVAAGMTGFVASGDYGAYATGDKSTLDVQFPGSDPNVVAVGGTTLTINNDGSYGSESGLWCPGCFTTGWGGGGGNSVTFSKPSWQSGVAGVSGAGRGVPDVSLEMDFHYLIYYGGSLSGCCWGGTSFAAPEWNGIMATIIYATTIPSTRFGNINTLLYSATPNAWTASRRDVITGANGYTSSCGGGGQPQCGYSAGSGWDYATGWGSLNGIPAVAPTTTTTTLTTTNSSTSTSLVSSTTTTSSTSYTGTSTLTSTVPVTVTVVQVPVTVMATTTSTSVASSTSTTTLISHTGTSTSTSVVVVTTSITMMPTTTVTALATSTSTAYTSGTSTSTLTSYTGTSTSTSVVVVTTSVTVMPTTTVNATVTFTSTAYTSGTTSLTVTSYTGTFTSIGTVVVTTTVTALPSTTVTALATSTSTAYASGTTTLTLTSYTGTSTASSAVVVTTTVTALPSTTVTATATSTSTVPTSATSTVSSYSTTSTSTSTVVITTTVTLHGAASVLSPSTTNTYTTTTPTNSTNTQTLTSPTSSSTSSSGSTITSTTQTSSQTTSGLTSKSNSTSSTPSATIISTTQSSTTSTPTSASTTSITNQTLPVTTVKSSTTTGSTGTLLGSMDAWTALVLVACSIVGFRVIPYSEESSEGGGEENE